LCEFSGSTLIKLNHTMAAVADEMMVAASGHQNKAGSSSPLIDGMNGSNLTKQIKGTIHGHSPYMGRLGAYLLDQFISRDVSPTTDQGFNDRLPGRSYPVFSFFKRVGDHSHFGIQPDGLA
jgi:hypothetical protein